MRKEISKGYYIHEMEFGVLLAVKGLSELYGICLSGIESITQTELYQTVFHMMKKGILSKADSQVQIEESLDSWIDTIIEAQSFIVFADADELIPESYFYVADDHVILIQPAGQQSSLLYLEKISRDEMWELMKSKGLQTLSKEPVECKNPPIELYEEARDYWLADKEDILQKSRVKQLLQEYDIHTKCKKRQMIKFVCGLDEYMINSDDQEDKVWNVSEEGGEVS